MGSAWKTKYGMLRVHVDPPTLEEALYAAEGLTSDPSEQLQIAAELMHYPLIRFGLKRKAASPHHTVLAAPT